MVIDMQYSLCTLVEFVFMPCYVVIVIIFQQCSMIDWVIPWHRQLNWVVRTALLEAPLKSVRGVNWKRILGSRPQSTENPILNGALFLLLTKSGPHLMREVISHRRIHQDHCAFIVYICHTHTFSTSRYSSVGILTTHILKIWMAEFSKLNFINPPSISFLGEGDQSSRLLPDNCGKLLFIWPTSHLEKKEEKTEALMLE